MPNTGRRDVALEFLARSEHPIAGPVQIAPYEVDRVRDMAGMAVEVLLAAELLARAEVDQAIGGIGAHLLQCRAQPGVQPRCKAPPGCFNRAIPDLAPLGLPALEENVQQEYLRCSEVLHDPGQHRGILPLRRIVEHRRDALAHAACAEPFGQCRLI